METKANAKGEEIYYVPICREYGCNGNLIISINEYLFQVNCFCEKNHNHKYKLYFDTFDKFYLKEKIIKRCSYCFNKIVNKIFYKCDQCHQLYCSNCFIYDKHIKENLNNLKIIKTVCPKDDHEFTEYCIDCGKKLCAYCLKLNIDKEHKGHKIMNISQHIPSNEHIKDIKQKISKKLSDYENLIKSLSEWQSELNKKLEQLKNNLLSEIKILNKLFSNYNCDYNEFAYYENLFRILNDLDDHQNLFLRRFMETPLFEEKTFNIFKILTINKDKPHIIDAETKKTHESKIIILENISDEIMLICDKESIGLAKLDENGNIFFDKKNHIKFAKVSAFFISPDKTKIYAIPYRQNVINIFNYNKERNTLELSDEIIQSPSKFIKKFEQIDENSWLLMDENNIYLLLKDINKYSNNNKLYFGDTLYDSCKINNKYIITSQKQQVTFIKLENFVKEKFITNVDLVTEINSLILVKDFVLVNCLNGIEIISIKNKEMIQFIATDNICMYGQMIHKSYEDLIYIWDFFNRVFVYIFNDYELKLIKIIHCLRDYKSFLNSEESLKNKYRNFFITGKDLIFSAGSKCFIVDNTE